MRTITVTLLYHTLTVMMLSRHVRITAFSSLWKDSCPRACILQSLDRWKEHGLSVVKYDRKKSFMLTSSSLSWSSVSNSKLHQHDSVKKSQQAFLEEMKDWRGSSKSTSEFVTHFIASDNNITVEEAIQSVLLPNIHDTRDDNRVELESPEIKNRRREELMQVENDSLMKQLEPEFRHDPSLFTLNRQLEPVELLALGSVWFLPAGAPKDPGLGVKPMRLEVQNLTCILQPGDYLRVHHTPRRYPQVHRFDWSKEINESNPMDDPYPGVIVGQDMEKGYMVIRKPSGVPVHPTVDNKLENVVAAVGRVLASRLRQDMDSKSRDMDIQTDPRNGDWTTRDSRDPMSLWKRHGMNMNQNKRKKDPLVYVVTPQRLDHNTSGLFVVATKKIFAAYFAKLLRVKTEAHLNGESEKLGDLGRQADGQVQKKYRCLVCIQPGADWSKNDAGHYATSLSDEIDRLKKFVQDEQIIRHWLEPRNQAPHVFSQVYSKGWLECLLKITRVGPIVPVDASCELSKLLWNNHHGQMPTQCRAIAEVEVELMTGRAHQIRGQLSALGFPICGDAVYGGLLVASENTDTSPFQHHTESRQDGNDQQERTGYVNSEQLALQCCELQFPDVDYEVNKKGDLYPVQSERMNKFRLESAWWTPYLETNKESLLEKNSTHLEDLLTASKMRSSSPKDPIGSKDAKSDSKEKTIQTVQLAPGVNKYVLVKATSRTTNEVKWFVKSASPEECGGPFHADVARELLKTLSDANYDTIVWGGGRIDYDVINSVARVYGFSYGFGKGDHEFVSLLIQKEGIDATFDNSDSLY